MRILLRPLLVALSVALAGGPLVAAPLPTLSDPVVGIPGVPVPSPISPWTIALAGALVVFGITIRKDTASLAQKFVTRAGAAAKDYTDGVAQAGGLWETNTKAAETNYEQGVQQAIADKRFGREVAGSAGKYQANAVKLGGQRYQPGVANAQDAWAKGVEPALSALKSLTLPPRGPRRSPQNQQRANAVAVALGALKTGK